MNFSWPQYRIFKDGKRIIKVSNETFFEEYKVWGKYWEHYNFEVKQYNDALLLHDILNREELYQPISAETFEDKLKVFKQNYKQIN